MLTRDPFEVFGLTPKASIEEVKEAYDKLRAKYSEDRFLIGEAGNQGARNLMELEEAKAELKRKFARDASETMYGNCLGDIETLIRIGKYSDAQSRLDESNERTAEWHYLQSIIFYKREWLNEAKVQLQMAVNLEPLNQKYRAALQKLEFTIGNPMTNPATLGQHHQQQSFGADPRERGPMDSLLTCCALNCCLNCCCAICFTPCQ